MSRELPPALVAHADQLRAELAEIVADKRRHDEEGCSFPDLCPGQDFQVAPGSESLVLDLLRLAIVELARSNYRKPEGE